MQYITNLFSIDLAWDDRHTAVMPPLSKDIAKDRADTTAKDGADTMTDTKLLASSSSSNDWNQQSQEVDQGASPCRHDMENSNVAVNTA